MSEPELIGTNDLARRLGVSATAIKKALDAGRIQIAGEKDSGRKLYEWPAARDAFLANSTVAKRSHVGSRGSPLRAKDAPRVKLPTSARMDEWDGVGDGTQPPGSDGTNKQQSYADSRAARELYEAKLAELKFNRESGKAIDADEAARAWTKHITTAKTKILGIPAAVKSRYADLPLEAVAIIESACREALEELADGSD